MVLNGFVGMWLQKNTDLRSCSCLSKHCTKSVNEDELGPRRAKKNSNCHGRHSSRGRALRFNLTCILSDHLCVDGMDGESIPDVNILREENMSLQVIHEGTIKAIRLPSNYRYKQRI